jgi:hypothetical protein
MSDHGPAEVANKVVLLKLMEMPPLEPIANNVEQDDEVYLHQFPGTSWIGTDGLAVCVALIVAAQDAMGGWKAGIHHFSGIQDAGAIFEEMEERLRDRGAQSNFHRIAIGGSKAGPEGGEHDPIEQVKNLVGTQGFETLKVMENPRPYSEQGDNSAACVKICVAGRNLVIKYAFLTDG